MAATSASGAWARRLGKLVRVHVDSINTRVESIPCYSARLFCPDDISYAIWKRYNTASASNIILEPLSITWRRLSECFLFEKRHPGIAVLDTPTIDPTRFLNTLVPKTCE